MVRLKPELTHVLLLLLLTIAAFSNSLTGAFVLDSRVIILEDPRIRQFTFDHLAQIVQHSYWWPYTDSNLYRPVTTFSYLFNYAILGNATSPFGYHLINLVVHTANVLLVYAISVLVARAHLTSHSVWGPFFAAAIWAVHPLTTEAVTNIVGRADLLAAFGVLASLYLYVLSGFGRSLLIASVLAATLGMFSKESGVAAVAVIVAYDLLFHWRSQPVSRLARHWVLYLIPIAALLYLRAQATPAGLGADPFVDNPLVHASFWTGRLTALAVAGRYLWLAIWPAFLSSDYSFAQIPLATGSAADWVSWIPVLAVLVGIVVLFLTNRRTACFSLLFACLVFLPASNLPFLTGTIMAERVFYLPLAGLAAAIVEGVFALEQTRRLPVMPAVALAAFVGAGGLTTFERNADWRDEVALWSSAAKAAPASFKAHQGLADALYESDSSRKNLDLDAVIAESDKAIAILDAVPDADNVGHAWRRAAGFQIERGDRLRTSSPGTSPTADEAYRRSVVLIRRYIAIMEATRTTPGSSEKELADAQVMLANSLSRLGEGASAIEAATRAQALRPLEPMPYRMLASALADAKDYDAAMTWLLAGFIVTGDSELRQTTIDMYQAGADPRGCAIKASPNGPTLNQDCPTVHAHLCAATLKAIQIAKSAGRSDLAEQLQNGALPSYGCSARL